MSTHATPDIVLFGNGWNVAVPKSGVEAGAWDDIARPRVAVPRLCGEDALVMARQVRIFVLLVSYSISKRVGQ